MHIITILELRAAKLSSYIGRAYVLASVAQVFFKLNLGLLLQVIPPSVILFPDTLQLDYPVKKEEEEMLYFTS